MSLWLAGLVSLIKRLGFLAWLAGLLDCGSGGVHRLGWLRATLCFYF